MKKLWLTYAWKDNEDRNIDFIIKELDKTNIAVKFDRRNLIPGQRLWQQIGNHITNPMECESWGIILTKNSIENESCIEELSYALERTLKTKGATFPIFALLHEISPKELPPALSIRLCIILENNNWVDQVIAAVNKTSPGFSPEKDLSNFIFHEHKIDNRYCLEIKPRFDRINPHAIVVDYHEKESGNVTNGSFGPSGIIPNGHVAFERINSETRITDGTHCWVWGANNEINSTNSIFLFYKKKPKRIWFGHQENLEKHDFELA